MYTSIPLLLLAVTTPICNAQTNKKVLLSDVQVLTVSRNKMTTGRRSSPVKQMKCVGGDACSSAVIETMQCYNRGFDGRDVQWECKADLEDLYRFGTTDVSCEGYAHKNDKYILAGSCGVEYTLYLTEKGKQYNKNKNRNTYDSRERFDSYQNDYEPERPSMVSKLVWMVVAGIFLYSMYTSCIQAAAGGRRNNGGAGARNTGSSGTGGGGGGGSGGFGGGPGFGGGGSGGGGSCNDPPMNSRPQTQGPGFWSGLGLGSLLGSMMNRPRYNTYNAYGGGGFGAGPSMRQRPPVYRSSSSSSSSSSSGPSTRTASGFGGTNRR